MFWNSGCPGGGSRNIALAFRGESSEFTPSHKYVLRTEEQLADVAGGGNDLVTLELSCGL